jgi:hypothetical protein
MLLQDNTPHVEARVTQFRTYMCDISFLFK